MSSLLEMSGIRRITDLDDCTSQIKWRLTDVCNYHCSYCIRRELAHPEKLESDIKKCLRALPDVSRVVNKLPGTVKIDLIGGEVSLLPLQSMLTDLLVACDLGKLRRLNITTNLSNDPEWYRKCYDICKEKGCLLGITASWHHEHVSLDDYLAKVNELKDLELFRCETPCVAGKDEEEIRRFMDECGKMGVRWFVERDIRGDAMQADGLFSKASEGKADRYEVEYTDGTVKRYKTRNFFVTNSDGGAKLYGGVNTAGCKCSRDYSYVYIEQDRQIGRTKDGWPMCRASRPLSAFEPLDGPGVCVFQNCSLCGHVSLTAE